MVLNNHAKLLILIMYLFELSCDTQDYFAITTHNTYLASVARLGNQLTQSHHFAHYRPLTTSGFSLIKRTL